MLVLSRKKNESIVIADDVVITIVEIRGDKVRLGIEAPNHIRIHRQEVYEEIQAASEPLLIGREATGMNADVRSSDM